MKNEAFIRNKIKKLLFEDTWNIYGSEYMSHPYENQPQEPPNLPVTPSDLMPNQLAIEKPPVEDEDYMPTNNVALSAASAAVAEEVPSDQVEFFFNAIKKSLEDSKKQAENPEVTVPEVSDAEEEEEADVAERESELEGSGVYANPAMENLIRLKLRKLLG